MRKLLSMFLAIVLAVPAFAAEIRVSSNITTDTYWTRDHVYVLDALVYVESGASLFIEAGTVIKGAAGQDANAKALFVCRGAKIFAEGTATRPIIFTAEADDVSNPYDMDSKMVGQWGGLVLLGNAAINHASGETHFEGIDANDLTLFGGTDDDDCSGVLRYVSIRHGGTQIGAGKEINGLSMAGVGRGTVISHVEVYANKDDAFEWWGGTVRCDHLVAAFCQDDAIDLDYGNRSKMQYVFVIQDANGDAGDTRIGEHDGCHSGNIGGTPNAHPVIYNATYLGAGKDGHQADVLFRLRENFGCTYRNSIFGDFNGYAVRIDSTTTPDAYDRLAAGDLVFENNIWFNFAAGDSWDVLGNKAYVGNYFGDAATHNDVLTGFALNGVSRTAESQGLDPRAAIDGPAYQNVAALPENDDFFEYAPYKGAFGPTNWAKGWTALDHYGYLAGNAAAGKAAGEIRVSADITEDTHWTAENVYVLDKLVYVKNGATLFIEAGTVIKGAAGQDANAKALFVTRGAKIVADGAGDRPIIFTAEADDVSNPYDLDSKMVGQWGGVVLLGHAPINHASGETHFEGIDAVDETAFGGTEADDCSGMLRYVSIRHGGTQIGAGKEINGLSMAGVGAATKVSYVEVYANKDDAFEWWGGNPRCDHLVAAFCQDDAIDLDYGNRSTMQYIFVIQDANGDAGDTRIGEHDGCHSGNIGGTPNAHPVILNATYLGAGKDGHQADVLFRLRENFGCTYYNSIFGDFNGYAVRIDSTTTPDAYDRLMAGDLVFNNNIWFNFAAGDSWDVLGNKAYVGDYFGDAATHNDVLTGFALAAVDRDPAGNGLDPRPVFGGEAYANLKDGAQKNNLDVFEGAAYKGAFGPTNWIEDWTALAHYGVVDGSGTSAVGDDAVSTGPRTLQLSQNYPNPFNPTTVIKVELAAAAVVKLEVYNILGQRVATLADGLLEAGVHEKIFDAADLGTGLYVARLQIGSTVKTVKMTLLK